jgi:beta-1,4-mannosyl-glycoprotein beta-1,4-N-acetylglucosaminyltransferase
MRIIDCITFFNEDMILDLRLNELDKYVDKFVIIELNIDHRGNKKKQNFNIEKFQKFKFKICYLYYEDIDEKIINSIKFNKLAIEHFQRNLMLKIIKNFNENDLIMISDCDEIPLMRNLEISNKYETYIFIQKMFYYKFNLQLYKKKIIQYQLDWSGTKASLNKNIKYPQQLRDIKSIGRYNFIQRFKTNLNLIMNGGWHFSFVCEPALIKKEIQSYIHSEYDTATTTDINNIREAIKKKKDIFGRNIFLKKQKLDNTFPKYILENQINFSKFIEK